MTEVMVCRRPEEDREEILMFKGDPSVDGLVEQITKVGQTNRRAQRVVLAVEAMDILQLCVPAHSRGNAIYVGVESTWQVIVQEMQLIKK